MNKPSGKISPEENSKVFEMLGDRRQSLSTAVVQLLLANQTSNRQWQLVVTGVACFVKDSVRRGYFIQVFDMDNCQRIWEQELYNEMIYKNPTSTFHTFEGDSTTVGLSFADNREAEEFKAAVNERLEKIKSRAERRKREKENKKYPQEISIPQSKEVEFDHNGNIQIDSSVHSINETHHGKKVKRGWSLKMKKNKSKSRLSKEDISLPEVGTFVHINGVASSDFHVSEPKNIQTKKSDPKNFKRPPPPPPPHVRQETASISDSSETESNMISKELKKELVHSDRESTFIRKKSGPPSYIPPPPPPPKIASSTVKSQTPLRALPKKSYLSSGDI